MSKTSLTLAELRQAAEIMSEHCLVECTGLGQFDRKVLTFWSLSTHALWDLEVLLFPILALFGLPGTGKSNALQIIGNFAYFPVAFQFDHTTIATIRDTMHEARQGTALIEEGDDAKDDKAHTAEGLLNARYGRHTESIAHKIKGEDGNYYDKPVTIFGATAIHRRKQFHDAAIPGKSIAVTFRRNLNRDRNSYRRFDAANIWEQQGRAIVEEKTLRLPPVDHHRAVSGRIFDTWKPVLQLAHLLGDESFKTELTRRMVEDSAEHEADQNTEPEIIVLMTLVQIVSDSPGWAPIKLTDVHERIRKQNEYLGLSPQQISKALKALKFRVNPSRGYNTVYPNVDSLLHACDLTGYEDDYISKLRKSVVVPPDIGDEKEQEKERNISIHLPEPNFATRLLKTKDLN